MDDFLSVMIAELRLRGRLRSSKLELVVGGRGTTVCMSTFTRLVEVLRLTEPLGGFGSITGLVGLSCVGRNCSSGLMSGSGLVRLKTLSELWWFLRVYTEGISSCDLLSNLSGACISARKFASVVCVFKVFDLSRSFCTSERAGDAFSSNSLIAAVVALFSCSQRNIKYIILMYFNF